MPCLPPWNSDRTMYTGASYTGASCTSSTDERAKGFPHRSDERFPLGLRVQKIALQLDVRYSTSACLYSNCMCATVRADLHIREAFSVYMHSVCLGVAIGCTVASTMQSFRHADVYCKPFLNANRIKAIERYFDVRSH
jgi:hypothetical protein